MLDEQFKLPEHGLWEEGIYQLETTDKARGYDYATDEDGPANIQATQLGNRTAYIKALVERQHSEEGHHSLTNDDFVTAAAIEESKIALHAGTAQLKASTQDTTAKINQLYEDLTNSRLDENINLSWVIQKLVPLTWLYSGEHYAFDMFTESMSLRSAKEFYVVKAVKGDDSLDLESTEGIEPGEIYVFTTPDGGEYQLVQVSSVLTDQRIRLSEASEISLSEGYLRGLNVPVSGMEASAEGDFYYQSGWISTFEGISDVYLYCRHKQPTAVEPVLQYNVYGTEEWIDVPFLRKDTTVDYQDDVFLFKEELGVFRIRLVYRELDSKVTFTCLALITETETIWIEDVFRPSIVSVQESSGNLSVTGDTYKSLYDIAQAGMEVQTSAYADFGTVEGSVVVVGETVAAAIAIPENVSEYHVRIRYFDVEGTYSRWSKTITLYTAG